jgi:hypothetical protein
VSEEYVASAALTRRTLIAAGAATVAAVVLTPPASSLAASADTFALDPAGGSTCTTGCSSCRACQLHGANKMFRTQNAADLGRAHPGCDCAVATGQALSQGVWDNVFQSSDMADRRSPATASLLAAEVEQHSVPLVSGLLPMAVLAGGAAGIVWIVHRRATADT